VVSRLWAAFLQLLARLIVEKVKIVWSGFLLDGCRAVFRKFLFFVRMCCALGYGCPVFRSESLLKIGIRRTNLSIIRYFSLHILAKSLKFRRFHSLDSTCLRIIHIYFPFGFGLLFCCHRFCDGFSCVFCRRSKIVSSRTYDVFATSRVVLLEKSCWMKTLKKEFYLQRKTKYCLCLLEEQKLPFQNFHDPWSNTDPKLTCEPNICSFSFLNCQNTETAVKFDIFIMQYS
jgi:hypothetical protein